MLDVGANPFEEYRAAFRDGWNGALAEAASRVLANRMEDRDLNAFLSDLAGQIRSLTVKD